MRFSGAGAILFLCALGSARADTAAVLPFAYEPSAPDANSANIDWIGESIAETVREALGSRGVLTLDRDDVHEAYHRLGLRERMPMSQASVMKIGEILDAEQVVYGTFDFTPAGAAAGTGVHGSLKITTRIVDRKRMHLGPEFTETGAIEDLATLEAHLTWRSLQLLAPKLAPPEQDFRSLRQPIRLDAEENYIRGLLAPDIQQKEKYFSQAARLDARFAHPCYELGQIHYQRKDYRQAADWLEKIPAEDIHFREANFLLGLARFQSGDYAAAQKAFQVIVMEVPLSEVYNNLGAARSRSNLPQAVDDFRKALEGDPNDPVYHFNLGYALFRKSDFQAAADRFRAVLDRNPDDQMSVLLLGRCLKKQGFRAGVDARLQGLERLKTNYEERAWRQLKAMLPAGEGNPQ